MCQENGVTENVTNPTVVCKYNESKGGVDIADQYILLIFIRKSSIMVEKGFLLLEAINHQLILFRQNLPKEQQKIHQRRFRRASQ